MENPEHVFRQRAYRLFDLQLTANRVKVLESPCGQAAEPFIPPLTEEDLRWLADRRKRSVLSGPAQSEVADRLRRMGRQVFQSVFRGQVLERWRDCLELAHREDVGLRLRLRLSEAGGWAEFPWEYLYDPDLGLLAADARVSMVRFLDWRGPLPAAAPPPIRVLALVCRGAGLDTASELQHLRESLGESPMGRHFLVDSLVVSTMDEVVRRLNATRYHILHFMGHCRFSSQGQLLLSSGNARRWVSCDDFSSLLTSQPELRLVVLNCCEGARSRHEDHFGGLAQGLLRLEIPAVVAMQFQVEDALAIRFTELFYKGLGGGLPVDVAVSGARRVLYLDRHQDEAECFGGSSAWAVESDASVEDLGWACPVVYMRSREGRLFDIAPATNTSSIHLKHPDRSHRGGRGIGSWTRQHGGVLLAAGALLLALLQVYWFLSRGMNWEESFWLESNAERVQIVVLTERPRLRPDSLDALIADLRDAFADRLLVYPSFKSIADSYPIAVYEGGKRKSYDSAPVGSDKPETIDHFRADSRKGATCKNGEPSGATGKGACAGKGGVRYWLYKPEAPAVRLCKDDRIVPANGDCGPSGIAFTIHNRDIERDRD